MTDKTAWLRENLPVVAGIVADVASEFGRDGFKVTFASENGHVAHECILDMHDIKDHSGISAEDIAKRLMDYGFHAPTMSWPLVGGIMIEPTESEDKLELDRYIDAMKCIRQEIRDIEEGKSDKLNNPLKNAPHTLKRLISDKWKKNQVSGLDFQRTLGLTHVLEIQLMFG